MLLLVGLFVVGMVSLAALLDCRKAAQVQRGSDHRVVLASADALT